MKCEATKSKRVFRVSFPNQQQSKNKRLKESRSCSIKSITQMWPSSASYCFIYFCPVSTSTTQQLIIQYRGVRAQVQTEDNEQSVHVSSIQAASVYLIITIICYINVAKKDQKQQFSSFYISDQVLCLISCHANLSCVQIMLKWSFLELPVLLFQGVASVKQRWKCCK